jgi:hypothetical protein
LSAAIRAAACGEHHRSKSKNSTKLMHIQLPPSSDSSLGLAGLRNSWVCYRKIVSKRDVLRDLR